MSQNKKNGFGQNASLYPSRKKGFKNATDFNESKENAGHLMTKANYQDAQRLYENMIKSGTASHDTYENLGKIYIKTGKFEEALKIFQSSLKSNPDNSICHSNLAEIFRLKGDFESALLHFEKAISLDQNNSKAFFGMGLIRQSEGNCALSKVAFHRSLELNPMSTEALFGLSTNIRNLKEAASIRDKCMPLVNKKLSNEKSSMLHFALSNCFHKLSDYSNSAIHLKLANRMKLSFMPSNLEFRIQASTKIFNAGWQLSAGKISDGFNRIFIVGIPRCGSTLLESALTTNPDIKSVGESNYMGNAFMKAINLKTGTADLASLYSEESGKELGNFRYSIDKNLYNFQATSSIIRAMPSAKIIHCCRHPMDNILSMLRSNMQASSSYASDPSDCAKLLIHQEKIMALIKKDFPENVFTFNYDSFVVSPEQYIRPLIKWQN